MRLKGVGKIDDVADVGKVVDKGADVVEEIGQAAIKRADKIEGADSSGSFSYVLKMFLSSLFSP